MESSRQDGSKAKNKMHLDTVDRTIKMSVGSVGSKTKFCKML